ncbi:hypothetical protein TSOC_000747 [Tetrabaena socialis]|uniref:SET domain-containing protein n=1 Tax=Tetrabaena socialis TaxID=47790 RepID=A0A2J8AIJ2_9CHLO|nr:hypothetical protein TSOC_000747 [Tetrabaena socialis]|eukprot:PNH12331.1 hypothetical protein TSOC_000747 [Tetrabaena socialis]
MCLELTRPELSEILGSAGSFYAPLHVAMIPGEGRGVAATGELAPAQLLLASPPLATVECLDTAAAADTMAAVATAVVGSRPHAELGAAAPPEDGSLRGALLPGRRQQPQQQEREPEGRVRQYDGAVENNCYRGAGHRPAAGGAAGLSCTGPAVGAPRGRQQRCWWVVRGPVVRLCDDQPCLLPQHHNLVGGPLRHMLVRATQRIAAGDEVTVCYLGGSCWHPAVGPRCPPTCGDLDDAVAAGRGGGGAAAVVAIQRALEALGRQLDAALLEAEALVLAVGRRPAPGAGGGCGSSVARALSACVEVLAAVAPGTELHLRTSARLAHEAARAAAEAKAAPYYQGSTGLGSWWRGCIRREAPTGAFAFVRQPSVTAAAAVAVGEAASAAVVARYDVLPPQQLAVLRRAMLGGNADNEERHNM